MGLGVLAWAVGVIWDDVFDFLSFLFCELRGVE
jgi:hypothetical protein